MLDSRINNEVPKYIPSEPSGAIRQGEIISGLIVTRIDPTTMFQEEPDFIPEQHPYVIVVSQDCDLDWDYKARLPENVKDLKQRHKILPNILFCMMTTARQLRDRDNDIPKDKEMNSNAWDQIRINKHERYHFFESIDSGLDSRREGIPELGVDFKRYFSVSTDEVYTQLNQNALQRCRLNSPYLEHFSTRFCYYQFRIALPGDYRSEHV